MPRTRTISPTFPHSPLAGGLSREARLFFILLWTVADDSGRLVLDPAELIERLFPFDNDAALLLPVWLDELKTTGCVERYRIEDIEYLRVLNWRKLQKTIQHPSRSRLPAAPGEPSHESHEAHEERLPRPGARASTADPHEAAYFSDEAIDLPGTPGEFTPERVLDLLEIALRKSLSSDSQTATARYIELAGRKAGLWGGPGAASGRAASTASAAGRTPLPVETLAPPESAE